MKTITMPIKGKHWRVALVTMNAEQLRSLIDELRDKAVGLDVPPAMVNAHDDDVVLHKTETPAGHKLVSDGTADVASWLRFADALPMLKLLGELEAEIPVFDTEAEGGWVMPWKADNWMTPWKTRRYFTVAGTPSVIWGVTERSKDGVSRMGFQLPLDWLLAALNHLEQPDAR